MRSDSFSWSVLQGFPPKAGKDLNLVNGFGTDQSRWVNFRLRSFSLSVYATQ